MNSLPRFVASLGLVGLGLGPVLRLAAQDVTIGEPVWRSEGATPEEMPKPKRRLRPDYPMEMKNTGMVGYVTIQRFLDEKGVSRSLGATGSHLPFQRAVEEDFSEWNMTAARRGGKPVEGRIWMPVIFNPKSATVSGPDATPRLLKVTPVVVDSIRLSGSRAPGQGLPSLPVMLSLDASGAIVGLKALPPTHEQMAAPLLKAMADWRFAPARQGGQPMAAEVAISVICETRPKKGSETKADVQPRALDQRKPIYPRAMVRYGITGQVVIDFIVDAEGKAQDVRAITSDNPAFDEPAIIAVREWKFKPGTKDGKPVAVHMQVPVVFSLNGDGQPRYRIDRMADQSKLPPEMWYDTPPVIRGVLVPVYPYAQRRDGVSGKAKAAVLINETGGVSEVTVQEASQPEFGKAMAAALEGFRFDPAYNKGKPVPHIVSFEQIFSPVELPDEEAERVMAWEKKKPELIYSPTALDTPLKPLSRRPPIFPVMASVELKEGEALVECIVDKEGRVRAPRIVSASHEAFGYAAVQGLAAWWFEPGLVGGKPVAVRVRIPVRFGAPPKPAKGAPLPKSGTPIATEKK
jgi:TonB family protein